MLDGQFDSILYVEPIEANVAVASSSGTSLLTDRATALQLGRAAGKFYGREFGLRADPRSVNHRRNLLPDAAASGPAQQDVAVLCNAPVRC